MSKSIFLYPFCLFLFLAASTVSPGAEEQEHPEVFLMDYDGNEILPKSNVPYSPKNTCGGCHDYEAITNAYHFQQGRADGDGKLRVSDDMDPRNPWLISLGMYGKW
jgi:hypothetical protein